LDLPVGAPFFCQHVCNFKYGLYAGEQVNIPSLYEIQSAFAGFPANGKISRPEHFFILRFLIISSEYDFDMYITFTDLKVS
jgi:hypothetical protein